MVDECPDEYVTHEYMNTWHRNINYKFFPIWKTFNEDILYLVVCNMWLFQLFYFPVHKVKAGLITMLSTLKTNSTVWYLSTRKYVSPNFLPHREFQISWRIILWNLIHEGVWQVLSLSNSWHRKENLRWVSQSSLILLAGLFCYHSVAPLNAPPICLWMKQVLLRYIQSPMMIPPRDAGPCGAVLGHEHVILCSQLLSLLSQNL